MSRPGSWSLCLCLGREAGVYVCGRGPPAAGQGLLQPHHRQLPRIENIKETLPIEKINIYTCCSRNDMYHNYDVTNCMSRILSSE